MILRLLAFFSFILHLPLRVLCRLPIPYLKSEKAKKFLQERQHAVLQRALNKALTTLQTIPTQEKVIIHWIHVASAGELEQAVPVLRSLHQRHRIFFFLTYYSPSACSFTENCPGLLAATSLPPENANAYRAIIETLQIRRILLVRYDFWPVLMLTAQRTQTPVAVLSATLNKARSPLPTSLQKSLRYFWFKKTDLIFLVSAYDREELLALDVPPNKLLLAGDAKWLRAKERADRAKNETPLASLRTLSALFSETKQRSFEKVVVFGSPHEEELCILERCLSEFLNTEMVILAPSEVDELSVRQLQKRLRKSGADVLLLSHENAETLGIMGRQPGKKRILILDGFGYLAEAYRYADLAIIGGGFDGQLHNVLEPAAYPVLTLFGNRFERAPEARLLLERKAAVGFVDKNELFQFLLRWSNLKTLREEDLQWARSLEQILRNAQDLFSSIPDTSEVVCRALATQDNLKTT